MTPALHHLVYQSMASAPLDETELEDILAQSRAWNTAHGLTGVLLHSQGHLMQVLEGSEDEVRYIFARIARDARHNGLVKLADGRIAERHFGQWSMGFKAVNPADFSHLQGYIDPQQPDYLAATEAAPDPKLHAVLAAFVTDDVIRF